MINHIETQFFWRKNKYEVDIISIKENKIIPIEVKYKNNIRTKDMKGL